MKSSRLQKKLSKCLVHKKVLEKNFKENCRKEQETQKIGSEWWMHATYLDCRLPVVVWSSPGLVFPPQVFNTLNDQLQYAAYMVAAALDYKIMVDEKTLPLDKMGGEALDMSQHFKLFSTCRIPGIMRDSIAFYSQDPNPPKHIVVAHNNHFFRLDVYGQDDKPLNVSQIFHQLRNIVERSTHPARPVGVLSTQNRNVWGRNYEQLHKDELNRSSIDEIQRCIFMVCVDGPINKSCGSRPTDAALQCLHGNGINGNAGNRWYDKTIQFIVGKKGEVGFTCEHAPADGSPLARFMDYIVKYINENKRKIPLSAMELPKPKRLMFNIADDMDCDFQNAQNTLQSLVEDLEITCFRFEGFGNAFIKSVGMSPDSFVQMTILLAFYRIHKEPGAHYESASTRKFMHGRTETIRSCSVESVEFARAMLDQRAHNAQKVLALKSAIEAHRQCVKDALNGCGIDRHLLGLKMIAIESGIDVPSLFTDVSFIRSSHMRLSTSQVAFQSEILICFGPLVTDGYGCCYSIRKDSILFSTSALNSSPETHSLDFRKAIEESLLDIRQVLLHDSDKSKL